MPEEKENFKYQFSSLENYKTANKIFTDMEEFIDTRCEVGKSEDEIKKLRFDTWTLILMLASTKLQGKQIFFEKIARNEK